MELRVLQYFLTVVREGNISRAAQTLHITQPTFSRQMMQLEEEMGKQLFIRGKKKITLTQKGMLLKRRAEEILELTEKVEIEMRETEQEITGTISIGSAKSSSAQILTNIIKLFNKQYPKITYCLLSGNAEQITEKIDRGLLDVGLLIEPAAIDKYDFVRLKQEEKWGVLMRSDAPLAKKEFVTAEDIVGLPVMITNRFYKKEDIVNWFGENHKNINVFITYNLIANAALLVQQGMGYAVTIEGATSIYENKEFCFRPFFPPLTSKSVLVWKKHQTFSEATTKFIEYIKILSEHDTI